MCLGTRDPRTYIYARATTPPRHPPPVTKIEAATTSRSTCRRCKKRIALGEWRVGLSVAVTRRMRRLVYMHLTCYNRLKASRPGA